MPVRVIALLAALIGSVVLAASAPAQESPQVPDGVIVITLPAETLRLERVIINGAPLLRLSAGKTTVAAHALGEFRRGVPSRRQRPR